jgi:23S rRNA (adenine2503-C2)-methyltransferase
MPSISTVAPVGRERFFDEILRIKNEQYTGGRFQMQFSIHTTDDEARRKLIPIKTLSLEQIAAYGDKFFKDGDRKITLNFATAKGFPLDPSRLTRHFSPNRFIIKLTPINPTEAAKASGFESLVDPTDNDACQKAVERFTQYGFETILSIGELDENEIGSNCGMYISRT